MQSKGISEFIKSKLDGITDDTALAMKALVDEVLQKYPHIKDTTNASVRVNSVLKQKKVLEKFIRIKGGDNKVYIILRKNGGVHVPGETDGAEEELQEENLDV
jgi:hypothetical protein